MKCEYCGGTLSLEDAFCPNCGRPNTQARQHQADMAKYQKEFEKTEEMVKARSKRYNEVTARVIILAVLVVASLVMFIVAINSYAIGRGIERSKANKKYNEYSKIMQEYIDNGQYLELNAFVEAKGFSVYDTPYESWDYEVHLARNYKEVFVNAQRYFFEYTNDYNGRYAEYFNDSLDYFYVYVTAEDGDYRAPSTDEERDLLNKMTKEIELMFKTYSSLTDEQIEGLPYMTKSKRGALLEDCMEVMKNGEE